MVDVDNSCNSYTRFSADYLVING